jgi:hypothetical protein
MTGNPLSGHSNHNMPALSGSASAVDGLADGDHIVSPTLTNMLEGVHGNGVILEEDTANGASNRSVPENLPGVCEQVTNSYTFTVTGGHAIVDGLMYAFAGGPGSSANIPITTSSAHKTGSPSALSSGQEALVVVYVSSDGGSANNIYWEMGSAVTAASNTYPSAPSSFLNFPDSSLTVKQSVVLAVLRVVFSASGGDLKVSISESNDKRVFVRPSPLYFSPVTTGAVGAANAPVDLHTELDNLHGGGDEAGDFSDSRYGALWQSHGSQLSSTTAPDNEKDTLYYSGNHAARYTRSVFDRVLTSTATSITLKSTDANILLLTPGGSATVTTSGSFPAGYIIELRNLHASNAVVFTRASNYSVAGGTLTRFVCTTSHATTPVFSVLSDDSIETVQLADNAVTLAKLDGIPRGKIIVGDASGDPSHLAAGSNGKLLVADANGDPSWTTVSGDVTISAGAVTIGNDKIDSQHYVDGSIDTAHIGDDQVTYAKIQNVSATNKLLGRDSAGAGIIEEISPADVRTMLNVADGATAYTDANAIAAVEGESTLVLQSGVTVGTDLKLTTSSDNVVIENVTSNKDIIFQVNDGGSANTEVMRVDGSSSRVGIGATAPTSKLEVSGDTAISRSADSGQTRTLSIEGARNATGTDYARIDLKNYDSNSGSPATYVGARIAAINEATGVDDGSLVLSTADAGTLAERMRIKDSGEVVIGTDLQLSTSSDDAIIENVTSDKDIIFKVNDGGATTEVMRIDGSTSRVGIGQNTPTAPLHVKTTGVGDAVIIESTEDGATDAPDLILYRNSASPAVNDVTGSVKFRGKDAGGNDVSYVELETKLTDVTDGSEDSKFQINMLRNGAVNELFTIGKGECVINEASTTMEFRVESATNTHMFFVDAHAEGIGIQNSAPTAPLHIKTTGTDDTFIVESTSADANHAPDIIFYRNSASAADNDGIGHIKFRGTNDAGTPEDVEYADFYGTIRDASDGTEDGELNIRTMVGGALTNRIHIDPTEIAINEDSASLDFRVEGNGNANMLFVDASADAVGIGLNTPSATLDLLTGGTFRNTRLLTVSVSGSTTLTEAAHAGRYNICAGNITLPSTSTAGEHYAILNTTGGNITIGRNGNNINGAGSDFTLATFKAATCIAIGSNNWMVVG